MALAVENPPVAPPARELAGQFPTLTEHYRKTQPGSSAEDDLVRKYLPLVKTIVGRLAMSLPSHIEGDDLYSAGTVGLLNAVRQYNPRGGSSFESYARVRIRGAVLDELRRLDWVPRSVHEKSRQVQSAIAALEQRLGRLPEAGEIAHALGLALDDYERLLEEIRPATFVCLDSAQNGEDDLRHESIGDSSQEDPAELAARKEMAGLVARRLGQLPDAQRKVLAFYYFEGLRLREIAAVFGVTESRICQIHAEAVLALKAALRRHAEILA